MKCKSKQATPRYDLRPVWLLVVVCVLAVSLATSVFTVVQAHSASNFEIRTRSENVIQQDPASVAAAFDAALNAHDVDAGLALFADDAAVYDPSNIACLPGAISIRCQPIAEGKFTPKVQIRGWLQLLAQENIEVKDIGKYQVSGDNVTWSYSVSVDEYRRLNVAPLVASAQALVDSGKIRWLRVVLNADSEARLQAAFSSEHRSPYSAAASGFALGIVSLGLVFPAAAVYYISRVKRLFATVPRLDKPWMLLGAGVGSLFVSVLLVALRDIAGMSTSIVDAVFDVVLVICAFLVMSAMILMKRVMISEPDE